LVATLANVNRASYFSKKGNNPTYVRKKYVKKKNPETAEEHVGI